MIRVPAKIDSERLEIRLARTIGELRDAFRVRYAVFVEEKHMKKEELPEEQRLLELELDCFDFVEPTRVFNAYYDGTAVGTVRLILDSEYGFPLERKFPIFTDIKKSEMKERRVFAEGSRIAILKDYRGGKISWGLLKADIILAAREGVTDIISVGNIGDVGFDVANNVFIKLGYNPLGDISAMQGFGSRIMPLHLKMENIKDPFRSKMVEDTPYIERPYNQIDPDNLLEKR